MTPPSGSTPPVASNYRMTTRVSITVSADRVGAFSACRVAKGKRLRFAVRHKTPWLKYPVVTFDVENHGAEAKQPTGAKPEQP